MMEQERLQTKSLISNIINSSVDFRKSKFYSLEERLAIINLVDSSSLQNKYIISCLGTNYSTYLGWIYRYRKDGAGALRIQQSRGSQINRIPDTIRKTVIEYKKQCPYLSATHIAAIILEKHGQFIAGDSVRNILKKQR
ncbi:MAG: helix-turn-helix domain-containing protein [Planctomycetes bacterium]|nr:helix-turn-helix domain-containing protein [Planctomycetota bacterium]